MLDDQLLTHLPFPDSRPDVICLPNVCRIRAHSYPAPCHHVSEGALALQLLDNGHVVSLLVVTAVASASVTARHAFVSVAADAVV